MNEIQQEIVPITQDDLFVIKNHPNAKFDYPIHCHPEYEINLVMNTSGTRVVGDDEEAFDELDLVMTGPFVPHVWKSELVTNHVITIQFSSDLLSFQMINKRLFMPIRQLLIDSMQGLHFYGPEAERIRNEIVEITRMQGFQTATKFLNILNLLAYAPRRKLVSNMYESENLVNSSKSRRITKACKYIEENISQKISLSDVAMLVNMSDSAFSHFFKKKTGISFITYVNNLRVAKACDLLASTSLSASEICYDCGFNNKSNFIRIFTKRKNMTPIEYRNHISQILIKY
ncbi:MAG: helix-turn-helix domain-containing protein [Bacteroidales bacterium]|nr:helix-turn-helix domain-containing protein [Bacteroidales bacterium]MBR1960014.1 helix-turn-helix domain-containing protein [Bacteroidales bacterium]